MSAKEFYLDRIADATGISGTGRVAHGVVFDDGTVVLRWLTRHRSTCLYSDIGEVEAIHGHNGSTKIVYLEGRKAMKVELTKTEADAAIHALGNFVTCCDHKEQRDFFGSTQLAKAARRAYVKLGGPERLVIGLLK